MQGLIYLEVKKLKILKLKGEVEQISLMKPKATRENEIGLLEYLEDIIGSHIYKKKIEEIELVYDSSMKVKREKIELVKISEKDLASLEDSKRIAIKYVKKEKQIFQLTNVVNQLIRFIANEKMLQAEEEVANFQLKLKEEQKIQKIKAKENEEIIRNFTNKNREYDECLLIIQNIKKKFDEMQKKDIKLKNEIKYQVELEVRTNVI